MSSHVDAPHTYATALLTQDKTADAPPSDALPCPHCPPDRPLFDSASLLWDHAKQEHASLLPSRFQDTDHARTQLRDAALRM
jgi:hypothetical protein